MSSPSLGDLGIHTVNDHKTRFLHLPGVLLETVLCSTLLEDGFFLLVGVY